MCAIFLKHTLKTPTHILTNQYLTPHFLVTHTHTHTHTHTLTHRLSCEPAVKVKDLYNSWQESENQQVNVDGEEDETKDNDNENEVKDITMTTTETHSQPEGSATTKPTETGQKKQSSVETTSEAECSATRTCLLYTSPSPRD